MTSHVARMEECRSSLKTLAGKPTGWRSLGRPGHNEEENIRSSRNRCQYEEWG